MIGRRSALRALVASPAVLHFGTSRAMSRTRIGLSLPLTGVQGTVANELLAGYQLAAKRAELKGAGAFELVIEDDRSEADRTRANIEAFGRDPRIVATSGVVGTPHAKVAIPAARVAGLPIVGLRSGASELRDGGQFVYHLRASFEGELSLAVQTLSAVHRRIAILASDDAFGRASAAHTLAEAKRLGFEITATVFAQRNGGDVRERAEQVVAANRGTTAVFVLLITKPAIEAVRVLRARSFLGVIYTMSFTAGAELGKAGPDVYRGLGLVAAFPLPRSAADEISEEFRAAATAASRPDLIESITAAEGYWYMRAISQAVEQAEGRVSTTRQGLLAALESQKGVALGSERIAFDSKRVGRRYLRAGHFDADGRLRV